MKLPANGFVDGGGGGEVSRGGGGGSGTRMTERAGGGAASRGPHRFSLVRVLTKKHRPGSLQWLWCSSQSPESSGGWREGGQPAPAIDGD